MAVAFSNYSLEIENAMQLFYHTLSEKERRRYVAVEAVKLGYGGQSYIASVVGCNRDTVASGIAELATLPDEASENRIRRPGGGRKKATVSEPDLVDNFFFSRRASHCR
jgi:hypothetical protein